MRKAAVFPDPIKSQRQNATVVFSDNLLVPTSLSHRDYVKSLKNSRNTHLLDGCRCRVSKYVFIVSVAER